MGRYDGNHTGARKDPNRKNYINHIALVLDGSSSIPYSGLDKKLIAVADDLVKHLATKSVELNQETRVTIYTFADKVECVVFDKDVLRLPSIAELYEPYGNTALLDATALSVEDLRQTMVKYGDHAFLTYVITDGEENRSIRMNHNAMSAMLKNLRENETVAILVPNDMGVRYALSCGFQQGNISKWEVTEAGLEKAATTITRSVDTYMSNRTLGVRATKSVFSMDSTAVNTKTVNSKKLTPLSRDAYTLLDVKTSAPTFVIRDFVESFEDEHGNKREYEIGKAFYQLTKTETIQKNKAIAIQNIHSGRVYTGQEARDVLNLPNDDARIKPNHNDEYRIYVQSTSVNRKLVAPAKLLLLK
jgi:von Willebrand factor type A domain.